MKTRKIIAFMISIVVFATSNFARADLTRAQRVSDAQTMVALFEHRYAPIRWKRDYLGISLDELAESLMASVDAEGVSDEDFYATMARFSGGVKDTHNWFLIPSTYSSTLGFETDYIEGRVLIDWVDRSILPNDIFPYGYGDEVISIDGKPVIEIIAEMSEFVSHGNELAELRFLARDLTTRSQRRYPRIPTGKATVKILSRERGSAETVDLKWITSGRPLAESSSHGAYEADASLSSKSDAPDAASALKRLRWSAVDEGTEVAAGLRHPKPFFPLWDSFVERTTAPLFSGIFALDGYRIGFIRIPTWYPPDDSAWYAFFEREIPFLDSETDVLVIDQTNNGGGSICLGEGIAGFFVTETIPSNLFEIRANRYFLQYYEEVAKWCDRSSNPDSEECQIIYSIVQEMRRAIAAGDILTAPVSICGTDGQIHPHETYGGTKTVYTKPILMLINEWSISTADMTPAPLQDSGSVVMFGGRTCGAGGNVSTSSNIGYSDFQISQTESLTVRPKAHQAPNGTMTRYLENVGVIPDIEYQITEEDFLDGYTGYRNAIDAQLRRMLK